MLRSLLDRATEACAPIVEMSRPYVTGLQNLPADGRFLLVGNHTHGGNEVFLIPYFVRAAIGAHVRPLADRQFGRMRGLQADLFAAYGAVVGTPDAGRELMQGGATILVFPGGAREVGKFKGEEYTLRWKDRNGFARLAVECDYPIVTAALVGGDDVYASLVSRDSVLGRASMWASRRLSGRADVAMPLVRGVGPTLIPRPRRMYLAFGRPTDTAQPADVSNATWIMEIKDRVERDLREALGELQRVRGTDPYRHLNPLARRLAVTP